MLLRLSLTSLLSACAVGLALAGPTKDDEVLRVTRTEKVPASRFSTYQFFPPIVRNFAPMERPVGNRFRPPWRLESTDSNSIQAGEVEDYAGLSGRGALWTSITFTGWVPADPTLAVGPNHVVVTTNTDIGLYTKGGTEQLRQDLTTFFASTGVTGSSFVFDPKCYYDKLANRFVVVALEQTGSSISKLLLAVSDNNDPNGTWYAYRLEARVSFSSSTYWLDYPGVGYNKDGYLSCGNLFQLTGPSTDPGYLGVEHILVRKSSVLSGGAATVSYFTIDTANFGVQPAQMMDPNADRIYMASDINTSSMRIHVLTDILGTPTITKTSLSVPSYGYPPGYAQSAGGHRLDPLDGRILTAVWRGGKLVFSQGTYSNPQYRSRWYEVNTNNYPSSSPTLAQSGNVANASTSVHYIMPAVFTNEFNDISMLFTRCSSSIVADMMATGRKTTDAAGTMGTPFLLTSGAGSVYGNNTNNRWGDYFAVTVDPNDDTTFWGCAMVCDGSQGWNVEIQSWTVTTPVVLNSVTLDATTVIGNAGTTGHVNMSGNAPPGGYVVALFSSNTAAATVPATVTVPAGASTAAFAITTLNVASDASSSIRATFRSVVKSQNLNVLWPSKVLPPTAFSKLGNLISGDLASLAAVDANRMKLKVSAGADLIPPVRLSVDCTSPISNPTKLEFLLTSRVNVDGRLMRIFFFDWDLNKFEQVFQGAAPLSETAKTVTLTSNFLRFIQAGTLKLRARVDLIDYLSDVTTLWEFTTDQAAFKVYR
ncbi:MAG: hypothetical protein HZC36_03085 [Armatimonadetes bacterium]|nr:hypothetical protein [Armatimonadota bacterium]